jgi:hypothetical protein
MDEFGYVAAARTGLRMFETCSRGSGRTMRLIERVTEQDQIIVPNAQIAKRSHYAASGDVKDVAGSTRSAR